MSMSLKVSEFSEWTILHLDGYFNAFNERRLLEALLPYKKVSKVGIDLSGTESINMRLLQEILRWSDANRATGGDFVLIAANDTVRRSMEIFVGLHRIHHVTSLAELSLRDFYQRPTSWFDGPTLM